MMKLVLVLFFLVTALNLYAQDDSRASMVKIRRCTKPFLMPLLGLSYVLGTINFNFESPEVLLLLALSFSWLGDVFLMGKARYDENKSLEICSDKEFMFGLSAFFLGHLFYVLLLYSKLEDMSLNIFLAAILVVLFWYALILFKGVKAEGIIKWGMIVYMLAIGGMIFLSVVLFEQQRNMATFSLLLGALFFGSSDSVLAFKSIRKIEKLPDAYVMFSYVVGQMFLVLGFFMN